MRRDSGKKILAVSVVLLLAPLAAVLIIWFHPYKNYSEDEKIILIPRGTSSMQLAKRLEVEGIVLHRTLFIAYLKTLKRSDHLQAGEYRFQGPLTIPQVADKIIRGLVYYHEVTVPEGFSFFEISDLLEQKGFAPREEFRSAAIRQSDPPVRGPAR